MKNLVLILFLSINLIGYSQVKRIEPSGKTVVKTVNFSNSVTQLSVSKFQNVIIEYGPTSQMNIEIDKQLENLIKIDNNGKVVELAFMDKNIWLNKDVITKVKIQIPFLTEISLRTINNCQINDVKTDKDLKMLIKSSNNINWANVSLKKLTIDVSSSNNLNISGQVTNGDLTITSSNINLINLRTDSLTIKSSASLVKVNVLKELTVLKNIASTIQYKGNKSKINRLDSKGSLSQIE